MYTPLITAGIQCALVVIALAGYCFYTLRQTGKRGSPSSFIRWKAGEKIITPRCAGKHCERISTEFLFGSCWCFDHYWESLNAFNKRYTTTDDSDGAANSVCDSSEQNEVRPIRVVNRGGATLGADGRSFNSEVRSELGTEFSGANVLYVDSGNGIHEVDDLSR